MSTQPEPQFVPEWTDGDKLRKLRRASKMNQLDFSNALGVKADTYAAWESDRNRIPEPKVIARKLKLLTGAPMWWFLDTENPHPDGDPDGGIGGAVRPQGLEPRTQ